MTDLAASHLDAETFAMELADFLQHVSWPIYGVELRLGHRFPLVVLWDAENESTRIIACTCDENRVLDALLYSIGRAEHEEAIGNAPCGAFGCMIWPSGWRELDGM